MPNALQQFLQALNQKVKQGGDEALDAGELALKQKIQALQGVANNTSPQTASGMSAAPSSDPYATSRVQAAIATSQLMDRIKQHDDAMKAQLLQQEQDDAERDRAINAGEYKDYANPAKSDDEDEPTTRKPRQFSIPNT